MHCGAGVNNWENEKGGYDSPETVESASGTLEGVDDVQSSNSLALGVFGVCYGVANDLEGKKGCKLG